MEIRPIRSFALIRVAPIRRASFYILSHLNDTKWYCVLSTRWIRRFPLFCPYFQSLFSIFDACWSNTQSSNRKTVLEFVLLWNLIFLTSYCVIQWHLCDLLEILDFFLLHQILYNNGFWTHLPNKITSPLMSTLFSHKLEIWKFGDSCVYLYSVKNVGIPHKRKMFSILSSALVQHKTHYSSTYKYIQITVI